MQTALWPILRRCLSSPLQTAVIDDQRRWRYIDLLVGAVYLAEKIESSSRSRQVGLLLPTSGLFPMALLATWLLNRTAVPINYLLSASERQYIVDDAELDTVVTIGPMLDVLGGPPRGVGLIRLEEMRFSGVPPLRWPPIADADSTAVILYTSGTSGRPKGVVLTHANLRSNVDMSVRHIRLRSADCFLGVLPQFHSFGLSGLTLIPLTIGAKVVYTARFVPRKIVDLMRKHRPDVFIAIPSMYNALMTVKNAKADSFDSIRLAISGGEPLPRNVQERFEQRFGVTIREGYGLTETSPIVSVNSLDHTRLGSVGRLIQDVDARIIDDAGQPLPPGQEGEILIKGPNIMAGYFKQPQLTASVIDDEGFFRTGDWGKLDADGYLYITGRKKEMLIIGGENVFPREIEEVLNHHASVKDSAVVGRLDPVRGELPVAFVELEGAEFDEAALRAHCRDGLAGFKVPRQIICLDELPRNPTGKVLRRVLADRLKEEGQPA